MIYLSDINALRCCYRLALYAYAPAQNSSTNGLYPAKARYQKQRTHAIRSNSVVTSVYHLKGRALCGPLMYHQLHT